MSWFVFCKGHIWLDSISTSTETVQSPKVSWPWPSPSAPICSQDQNRWSRTSPLTPSVISTHICHLHWSVMTGSNRFQRTPHKHRLRAESVASLGLWMRKIFILTIGPGSRDPSLLKCGRLLGSFTRARACVILNSSCFWDLNLDWYNHTSRFEQEERVDA